MTILDKIRNLFRKDLEPEGQEVVDHDTVMILGGSGELIEVTIDDTEV